MDILKVVAAIVVAQFLRAVLMSTAATARMVYSGTYYLPPGRSHVGQFLNMVLSCW